MNTQKEQWSSKFGFIMAASGSAIGLGNLWKFPYITGTNGGAIFLIIYIVFLFLLGIPILLSEMAIGRYAGLNAVDSCKKINHKWGIAGALGIIGSFTIMAGYCVVGGWVLKYIINSFSSENITSDYFTTYASSVSEPIIYTFVFIVITTAIVICGVANGIERISSVLLPILFVFIVGIMIYSLTLPNALSGVRFFIVPDFASINSISDLATIALNAVGQVFFSLSLGMGTLITYGSYLPKDSDLTANTLTIVGLDTLIAIIAGFAILPAVFSFGLEASGGPGLLFQTLPVVFSGIKGGMFVSVIFFVLVLFAAITSAISLLEVIVAWLTSKGKMTRTAAAVSASFAIFIFSIFASLSFGVLSDFKIFNLSIFDFLSFISDKIIMPAGGILICLLVGYIWGIDNAAEEISNGGKLKFRIKKLFSFTIRYISPALILIIFITSLL